jgi:hypothetical protein
MPIAPELSSTIYNYSLSASRASDALFNIVFAAPVSFFADQTIRKDWQSATSMYPETFEWVGSATELTKASVQQLPQLTNDVALFIHQY